MEVESSESNNGVISSIGNHLREAVSQLAKRGLHLANKWTCEQLIGIRNDVSDASNSSKPLTTNSKTDLIESDMTLLAQSLLNQGEYQRCAHLMRKNNSVKTNLSLFLSTYALYMAGEKLKNQQKFEGNGKQGDIAGSSSSTSVDNKPIDSAISYVKSSVIVPKNPFLKDLFDELYPHFKLFQSQTNQKIKGVSMLSAMPIHEMDDDSNTHSISNSNNSNMMMAMDGYHMFLFAIIVRDLIRQGGGGSAVLTHLALDTFTSHSNTTTAVYSNDDDKRVAQQDLKDIKAFLVSQTKTTANNNASAFPSVYTLFLYSLQLNPWNWSCWLELMQLCITENLSPPSWHDIVHILPTSVNNTSSSTSSSLMAVESKVMYDSFLAQYYIEKQSGELALQVLNELVYIFPNSQIIASQVALAHYSLRDYDKAQEIFESMKESDPYRIDHVDTFSNILYVKERSAELSHLAHSVVKIDKFTPETCCVVGNYYSLKAQHEKAIVYFRRALRLNSSFLSAWTLMGHEFVELRNTAAAIEAYSNAVVISASDYRAWYGLGQTYEMLHLYQYALYYYKKAAALKTTDARMWCAVGNCCSRLGMKQDAIMALQRAVSSGDREGIATRELARLYREAGQLDLAAECFRRHLRATSTSTDNNEEEQEERIMNTATTAINNNNDNRHSHMSVEDELQEMSATGNYYLSANSEVIDAERAEGLIFLANYHRDLGELSLAESYGARLMDYPGPEGDQARALLRELRSFVLASSSSSSGGVTSPAIGVGGQRQQKQYQQSSVRLLSATTANANIPSSSSAANSGVNNGGFGDDGDDIQSRMARLRRTVDGSSSGASHTPVATTRGVSDIVVGESVQQRIARLQSNYSTSSGSSSSNRPVPTHTATSNNNTDNSMNMSEDDSSLSIIDHALMQSQLDMSLSGDDDDNDEIVDDNDIRLMQQTPPVSSRQQPQSSTDGASTAASVSTRSGVVTRSTRNSGSNNNGQ